MGVGNLSTGGALQSITLDSTADALAWVGTSPVADDLAVVYFRTGTIPASGGDTVDIRIETVADGRPTGTLWAANTNVTVAIADADDNVWKTATLTAAATLAKGDEFAIVIASSAGTPSIVLAAANTGVTGGDSGMYPVILHNATGAYAVVTQQIPEWIASFTTAGIKHLPGLTPIDGSLTLTAFNNASSPNARALRFIPRFKCRVVGARLFIGNLAASSSFTVSLFNSSGTTDATALAQKTIDGDFPSSATMDGYVNVFFDEVDADNVLTVGDTYYIELRPDTANNITLFECTTAGSGQPAGSIKAFPQESEDLYLATRVWDNGAPNTAGAWSTTTTTYPIIGLLIDQLDDGAGGGGGMRLAGRGGLAA